MNITNKGSVVNIIIIGLFCLGLLAELVSINYLLTSRYPIKINVFLVAHLIGSILISIFITYVTKSVYESNNLVNFLFSLAILFFIPVLGVLVLVVVFRSKNNENGAIDRLKIINNSHFSRRKISNISINQIMENTGSVVSTKSITSILSSADVIAEERQKAVLDTIKLPDKEAIPLLRMALKDNEDDVRLLAYALLKRKENIVTSRLQNRLKKINEIKGSSPVFLHKAIAYDCWEMIYLELVQGEVQNYLFELAIKHIKISLKHNTNDPGSNLLFAKILLRKGDLVQSRKYFHKAGVAGIDRNKILPYFAEISFLEKKLCDMSKYISDISKDASSFKITRLVEVVNDK